MESHAVVGLSFNVGGRLQASCRLSNNSFAIAVISFSDNRSHSVELCKLDLLDLKRDTVVNAIT